MEQQQQQQLVVIVVGASSSSFGGGCGVGAMIGSYLANSRLARAGTCVCVCVIHNVY
jgi:hypothetical protein